MTTSRPDLYAILGVPPTAAQAQISRAYRALLRRYHPDTRSPGDESEGDLSDRTLQQVLAAYNVLHDPVRRAAYDRQAMTARPRPPQRLNTPRAPGQPPIIAGPVRWHQAP